MIAVASIAVVMNTAIAAALSGDAKHSLNSRAAYVHMAGDALSSFAVVLAGISVYYTGWLYADPIVSSLIAVFIAFTAWGIVVDAVDVLLESTPKGLDVEALIAAVCAIAPVSGVHDLHIWTVGDGQRFLSCHVQVPAELQVSECAALVAQINSVLHSRFAVGHATIQVEAEDLEHRNCGALFCAMEAHRHDHSHDDHDHHDCGGHHHHDGAPALALK